MGHLLQGFPLHGGVECHNAVLSMVRTMLLRRAIPFAKVPTIPTRAGIRRPNLLTRYGTVVSILEARWSQFEGLADLSESDDKFGTVDEAA